MATEAFLDTQVQDCQTVSRAFEKGCNHSMTEESVFAMMTPQLNTMRATSAAVKRIAADNLAKSALNSQTNQENTTVAVGNVNSDNKSDNFFTDVGNNFLPGGDSLGGIFNSECIPCGFRINFTEELNAKFAVDSFWDRLEGMLAQMINQIQQLINMFKNLDKYIDLCAFLKFLKDFVCIPDLQKILGLLAAFMMRLALDLDLSFDLVLSLIAPLFMPFFSGLVEQLNKYLLMIIKPINCIIDAIQNILGKLDYNVLFQNFQNVSVSFGPRVGTPPNPVNANLAGKIPVIDKTYSDGKTVTVNDPNGKVPLDSRGRVVEWQLSQPFDVQRNKEQAEIEKAAKELQAVRKSAGNVNGKDSAAVASYRAREQAAKDKYANALRERNLSEIGEASQKIEQFQTNIKGAFFSIINYLRLAATQMDEFIKGIMDEFKKIVNEFLGGNGRSTFLLNQKLEVIQLVGFITAVIKALKKTPDCEEGKEVETYLNQLPVQPGMKVWSDDNGRIHIEEDDEDLSPAITELIKDRAVTPVTLDPNASGNDRTRQTLNSLIEFTGDPVLDTSISRAVDSLSSRARAVFKCPLQTSVAQAEQVNKWISELETT